MYAETIETNKVSSFKQFVNTNNKRKIIVGIYSYSYPSINEHNSFLFDKLHHLSKVYRCGFCLFFENYETVKWIRKLYPQYGRNFMHSKIPNVKTFLSEKHYSTIINTSKEIQNELYSFENVVDHFIRTPKFLFEKSLIRCISDGDFSYFTKNFIPQNGFVEAKHLFNHLRETNNLPPLISTRNDVPVKSKSEQRDAYKNNKLFSIGDIVTCKKDCNTKYIVEDLRVNYIVVKNMQTNKTEKKWIDDVIPV